MQDAQQSTFSAEQPLTKRGHERMVALLESATVLFLQYGFDAVSLDDIVHHAGGSKTSIYKYFGNKEGLFTAICDYRCKQFYKDICLPVSQASENLRAYLINTLINFYNHIIQAENAAFLRLVLEQSQRNTKLAIYLHEQGPTHIQHSLAEALQLAHERGEINCTNPETSAQMYLGIIRTLEWRILLGLPIPQEDAKNDQETINYINYCVDIFLCGHQKG